MRYVVVRGDVVKKENASLTIIFKSSNVFWDETDIGYLGKELTLDNASDANQFNIGETIIAEGKIKQQGVIEITEVYKNSFQPFGVDWKVTTTLLSTAMILLLAYFVFKRRVMRK